MTDIIQIKRSTTTGNVPTLAAGELAVNLADHRLFIGGASAQGYALGRQGIARTRDPSRWRAVGEVTAGSPPAMTTTAQMQYFLPLVVPRPELITSLAIEITTAAAGTVSLGLYDNALVSGADRPVNLLASAQGLSSASVGLLEGALSGGGLTLLPGVLYWASVVSAVAIGCRAVGGGSTAAQGRGTTSTTSSVALWALVSGSTLLNPVTAPVNWIVPNLPAIFWRET